MKRGVIILLILAGPLWVHVPGGWGLPGDVFYERKGGQDDTPPAFFPHWVHRIRYRCAACHPAPYEARRGANAVGMEMIQKGQSCGLCHNGKTAFGIHFETCPRCHGSPAAAGR